MVEKLVEWLAGETEVLGENLPQCRFVHHKPHMLPGREPGAAAVGSQPLTAGATARPNTSTVYVIASAVSNSPYDVFVTDTVVV
jgi:hypothetical protein